MKIFELRGVNFVNKGAELMLKATVQQVHAWDENNIVAAHIRVGNVKKRRNNNLDNLILLNKERYLSYIVNPFVSLLPSALRRSLHIVSDREVDVILDSSGFSYSDQWGPRSAERLAEESLKWREQKKKVILLPQAFGPFKNLRTRRAFDKVIKNVDLIFARDEVSYQYLLELCRGDSDVIKMAPDFTNMVEGQVPSYLPDVSKHACIIPNYRMIDKTSPDVSKKYPSKLIEIIKLLINNDITPFILIHAMDSDYELALALQSQIGRKIKIIRESDPIYIKGILSKCFIVISSRYHGLIGSLSQEIPSLATGWSHKYEMLLKDYGCPECLISPSDTKTELTHKLSLVIEEPSRIKIKERLHRATRAQRLLVENMWEEIYLLINK